MPVLTLRSSNSLKTSYGDTFDKLLDFFDEKYHFLETFHPKTQKLVSKTKTLNAKTKVVPVLTLRSSNSLKTSYGDTFDKLLDFLEQKYHFQETFDTKTQKLVSKTKTLVQKP